MDKFDVVVVGAGVVGLAIAAKLSHSFSRVLVIDKHPHFGEETSSRNSEVIHAGLYYPQDSLKAKFCVQGKRALYQYCQERHIPYKALGKLLVAHNNEEEAFLEKTIEIARLNDVDDLQWKSKSQLSVMEPALSASAALLSPSTGIIDVHSYMTSLVADLESHQGLFVGNTVFKNAKQCGDGFTLQLNSVGEELAVSTKFLVNSGGLHSTQVASNIEGMNKALIPELHWYKGHYFSYIGKSPFSRLIYPIPESNGLGIHASLDVSGKLKFGPDTQYVNSINYQVPESRKKSFYLAIKKYFPQINMQDLQPDYSGIRPKLQGEGEGFRDFVIQKESIHNIKGLINLFGIDSPGLTSSLSIANYVAKAIIGE